MRVLLIVLAACVALTFAAPSQATQHRRHVPPWLYTKRLAKQWYGWTGPQWVALDALVDRESGWNYCAHYPSTTDCGYTGSNACGIPQAYYCPVEWRGHLERWHRQVFWMLRYVRDRYGDPVNAAYHERYGGY